MIFSNDKNKLFIKKEIGFKLEKDLQKIVENNLDEIFGLKFMATEFSIEGYRFDSVAFNTETNSFVIIEYKRGKNESLVDQGYAYLYTLLDRKADFVLLYNEVFGEAKGLKDFEWSQTRIIFVSPQFTDYQKNATSFIDMPFELYEVKQYEGGIIAVNEINANKVVRTIKDTNKPVEKDEKISKVAKEIVVYTEDKLLEGGSELTKELYFTLKERILDLGNIKVEPKKLYIAFKGRTNICDIVIKKGHLSVYLNVKEGSLYDPQGIARMIKDIGHWGNGDYRTWIDCEESLDYLMTLIRQSYKVNG